MKTKHRYGYACLILILLFCAVLLSSCSSAPKKTTVRVIIIPKFEIGEMTGDAPGEAQLFYERYCAGCGEASLPVLPGTARFYMNGENGVALLVTGSGKTAAALSLMALLSSDLYDCSDAYIVSVGCGGGSSGYSTLGDVVLVTAACDYDLGHHVDSSEVGDASNPVTWFPDESYDDYGYQAFNAELCDKIYQLTKDCPLQTTPLAEQMMAENFAPEDGALRKPAVIKGTALSGDNFWKGSSGHQAAEAIASYYGAPDPYAITEMEEIAVANTAACFNMLDRIISFRAVVNMDMFMGDETPESLWSGNGSFNKKVSDENTETLDIFDSAMHNLFDVSSLAIDALLADGLVEADS